MYQLRYMAHNSWQSPERSESTSEPAPIHRGFIGARPYRLPSAGFSTVCAQGKGLHLSEQTPIIPGNHLLSPLQTTIGRTGLASDVPNGIRRFPVSIVTRIPIHLALEPRVAGCQPNKQHATTHLHITS